MPEITIVETDDPDCHNKWQVVWRRVSQVFDTEFEARVFMARYPGATLERLVWLLHLKLDGEDA
jgi:hypothetical protein